MKPYAVVIYGQPSRAYIESSVTADTFPDLALDLVAVDKSLSSVQTMRAGVSGEAGNVSIVLRPAALARFYVPPLNAPAAVLSPDGTVFAGVVSDVKVDASGVSFTIVQFGSEPLPLRETSSWGGFREAAVIPRRYGFTGGKGLQYNAERTQFVWGSPECVGIDSVTIGGADPGGWQWRNDVDTDGKPIALVEFAFPVDEGSDVLIRGRGIAHPMTGALMTNPADVMLDLLRLDPHFSGSDADFASFRLAAMTLGLETSSSVTEKTTGQTLARAIAASVGARYSPDAHDVAFLDPAPPDGPPVAILTDRNATISATVSNDGLVNDLTIRFDMEDGQPRQVIRLSAPDSIATYGSKADTFDADWIGSARIASDVGVRLVGYQARPRWIVTASGVARPLRVGDLVSVATAVLSPRASENALPSTLGPFRVLTRELDPATGKTTATFEVPIGGVPNVVIVSQAAQYDPNVYSGGTVETQGDNKVIHLFDVDENGNVQGDLANVAVTLDGPPGNGVLTRQTDGTGRVAFPQSVMTPGSHFVTFLTQDGRTGRMDFTI